AVPRLPFGPLHQRAVHRQRLALMRVTEAAPDRADLQVLPLAPLGRLRALTLGSAPRVLQRRRRIPGQQERLGWAKEARVLLHELRTVLSGGADEGCVAAGAGEHLL